MSLGELEVKDSLLEKIDDWLYYKVRRKTAPDFLVVNMIDLDKQFLNPAPKNARCP